MADETPAADAEAKAPAADEAKPDAPAPKGKGKLLVIVGVVVVLVGGAGAAWFLGFLGHGKSAEAKEEVKDAAPKMGALLALDPFVANLADEDGKRYLKANLQLEFFESKVPEEFNQRMPQIRDLLLTLFTSKLFAEIRTPAGKGVLRDEIINRLNKAMNKDMVKAVYFTEFIVQ
jgi:flagellar FliL protein